MSAAAINLTSSQESALRYIAARGDHGKTGDPPATTQRTLDALVNRGLIKRSVHRYNRQGHEINHKVWRATELGLLWYASQDDVAVIYKRATYLRNVIHNAFALIRAAAHLRNAHDPWLTFDGPDLYTALVELESYHHNNTGLGLRDVIEPAHKALRAAFAGKPQAEVQGHLETARKECARLAKTVIDRWDSYAFRHYTGYQFDATRHSPLFEPNHDATGYVRTDDL